MPKAAFLLFLFLAVPTTAHAQPAEPDDALERRVARAERLMRVGNAGFASISAITLVGEVQGYDQTWIKVATVASLGAIVTGFVGRKMKRDAEREIAARESRHTVAVAPLGGAGVAGVYALRW